MKDPSGMKKAPTVMAKTAANLKNQNLERGRVEDLNTVDLFVLKQVFHIEHECICALETPP